MTQPNTIPMTLCIHGGHNYCEVFMQQIPVAMLDVTGAQVGDTLIVQEEAVLAQPSEQQAASSLFTATYDPETGVVTYKFADGSTIMCTGFPTLSDLQRSGLKGEVGATGPTGAKGTDGRDGRDGGQGCPGLKGDRGRVGPTGPTGPQGVTGPQGITGEIGPTGPTGARGADAVSETYTVTPVYDLASGQAYTKAWQGSRVDNDSGSIVNMGRFIASRSKQTVDIVFTTPFTNRLVSLSITWLNQRTNQAQTFKIYDLKMSDGSWENAMLGGFILQSSGTNTSDWDFYYTAWGD